ncbi:hypothetical protein TcCL_NonESM12957, partial [Trypanosoma cruzi]
MKLHVGCQTLLPLAAVPAPAVCLICSPGTAAGFVGSDPFRPPMAGCVGGWAPPSVPPPPMTQRLSTFHPERIRFPDCRWRDCHPKRAMLAPLGHEFQVPHSDRSH